MPNTPNFEGAYIFGSGNPDSMNEAALPAPYISPYMGGQLGQAFTYNGNRYRIVQVDTLATTPAVGQLMYWKNKTTFVVTNVVAQAINGATTNGWRNEVAGVLRVAATAGNFVCLLIEGSNIPCACLATNAVGDIAISDLSANVGNVLNIAAGSAITYVQVGVFRSISSGNLANVDVDIRGSVP